MRSEWRSPSCDTMVAVGMVTESGRTLLAKNSDRHPNEAQYLTYGAAGSHHEGAVVEATYATIPQSPATYATIGSRPWWMWGYEHGVNEKGLAVGNEALWSREEASAEPGLLGMDLLRLILERAATAEEGVDVLTGLLEVYGQSGSTSLAIDQTYHNGFLIADPSDAWVVETAGRHWAAKRVRDVATISNAYSLRDDYDLISSEAESYAVERGWWPRYVTERFDFGAAYADPELSFLSSCTARLARSGSLMHELKERGDIKVEDMFGVLRDIGELEGSRWRPGPSSEGVICMHAQDAQGSETAASMVAELSADPLLFASLSSPRLSSFVPVWFGVSNLPWTQPFAGAEMDEWWQTERMQRLAERDYAALAPAPEALFAEADRRMLVAVRALPADADAHERAIVTAAARKRRARLVAASTELLDSVADELIDPDEQDPRGTYLRDIEALVRPTTVKDVPARDRAAL